MQINDATSIRKDLQGLRAIAILLVVIYHAGVSWLPGGYIGVDVFFVLSGFLITKLLVKEWNSTGCIQLSTFYARRIKRLLPASLFVLLITIIVSMLFIAPIEQGRESRFALRTLFFMSNIHSANQATNYLAADSDPSPFLHYWSLAVEEQFYLVWPLLLALTLKMIGRKSRIFPFAIALFVFSSFLLLQWLNVHSKSWAFFSPGSRAWELLIGATVAFWTRERSISFFPQWLSVLGLILIVGSGMLFNGQTNHPSELTIIPVLGTVLLLITGESNGFISKYILQNRWMVWIGDRSYSWYLWHWPIQVIGISYFQTNHELVGIVLAILSLGISALLYFPLEVYPRKSIWLGQSKRRVYSMAVICLGIVLIAIWGWKKGVPYFLKTELQAKAAFARVDLPSIYASGNHADLFDVTPKPYTEKAPSSKGNMILFGDSHAATWFPVIQKIANQEGYSFSSYTKSSCPAVRSVIGNRQLKRDYTECRDWQLAVMDQIRNDAPDIVVISNSSDYLTDEFVSVENWAKGIVEMLELFDTLNSQVVWIRNVPSVEYDVVGCLSKEDWKPFGNKDRCTLKISDNQSRKVAWDIETRIVKSYPNVVLLDPESWICEQEECNIQVDGGLKYRDGNHLTQSFVLSLYPQFDSFFKGIIGASHGN